MNRFRFEIATPADDEALRDLMRCTPMDGQMRISFQREPSFFGAAAVEGHDHQTLVCRDADSAGRVVAMGCRATRRCWVDDSPTRVGYLSGLRVHSNCRGLGLLARGYRLLKQIHDRDPLPMYLTTVAEGNMSAWQLLSSGRVGLPEYHHVGDFHSIAIPLTNRRRRVPMPLRQGPYELRVASPEDVPAVVHFWNRHGPRRQFFPVLEASDLDPAGGSLRGLRPADILLALHRGEVVGTLGTWDQTPFRQTVVHDYGRLLSTVRPAINGWARLRGRAGLPDPGQPLRLLFAAVPVARDDHRHCFQALLRTWLALRSGETFSHLVLGLSAQDPLLDTVPKRVGPIYRTRICLVRWSDGPPLPNVGRERPPFLELGCL